MRNHNRETIKQVLEQIKTGNWGVYGPSFPFQLDRYADFLKRETFEVYDPQYGYCHSFKFTITELGEMFLKYPAFF